MGDGAGTVIVVLPDGSRHEVERGATLESVARLVPHGCRWTVMGAKVGTSLRELTWRLNEDADVQFIDMGAPDGMRFYRRTGILVLVMAAREVLQGARVLIQHSLSNGLYGEIKWRKPLTQSHVRAIEERMHEIVAADLPIVRRSMPLKEAIELFRADGQRDKVRLLKYRRTDHINVYQCGWMSDYFYGYMAPSTGYLRSFRLRHYLPGFILEFPTAANGMEIPDYVEQGKLATVYFEAERWGRVIGVTDIASLNSMIERGHLDSLIQTVEALHEKK
ncbi:MAG: nucleoside kinase, partial [Dehalococcoidia bacterium]|nr:nucleoside kinase [Dehalococcoidia bacterium]